MKKTFPDYNKSGTKRIERKLSKSDKKALEDFDKLNAINSNEKRVKKYRRLMLEIFDVMEKPLSKITKKDVISFLGVLNQSDRKTWTKNDIKRTLKRFIKWKYKDVEMMDLIKSASAKRSFNFEKINKATLIKKEELEKLLRVAQSLKWKAILMTLYESACRPQELRGLRWKDLEFVDDGTTNITFFSEKKREARTIPIKESTVHLKRWKQEYAFPDLRNEDFVFPSQYKREKPLGDGTIGQILKRLCKQAGIRQIFPYLFRHSRITALKKENIDSAIIKKFAGHSSDSNVTDTIYTHFTDEDVRDALLKIYQVEELSEETKHKLEKRIDELEEYVNEVSEFLQQILKN